MSRIVRKQLFSLWESMQKAHGILQGMFADNKKEAIIDLLADCQECAIAMGSQIEEVYNGKHHTVQCLEQYCETIYHIVEHLENVQTRGEYCALAKQQLATIKETMEQEIPDKMEIAFFPYKVSWWDCLESIYLEASKDENCEVYCVPVPYHDLNQDKGPEEWHDESGKYPDNIRITDWQEYEFEIRKPDIIFIHNPYDEWSAEERVEPRFYAANLRTYTEMLVYVPHFSWKDIKVKGKKGVEELKRFCFLPGTIHADKVIVESEDMRMAYMAEYRRQAENQGITVDRELLDCKIVALGSPKTDRCQDSRAFDLELPEAWGTIMEKPDGGRKKVIYYYTGINGLLTEGEKLLDKIESVLAVMKKRQGEAALWWRPQPQISRMLKEMRPELWNRYADIVERYREDAWGIYDDTDNEGRVFAVMDGYYGDWSTGVWECHENGKPALIQNTNVLNCMESRNASRYQVLSFTDAWKEENELWVSNETFNGIFKIDMLSGKGEFIGRFDREIGCRKLYRQVINYCDWLIFIPDTADSVAFFHKKTHDIEYADIVAPDAGSDEIKIRSTCVYREELWMFPEYLAQSIMIINLKSRCVRYDDILEKTVKAAAKSAKGSFFGKALIRGSEAWIPIRKTPEIIKYDMDTGKAEFTRLEAPKAGINSMDAMGDVFWITYCDKSEITEWRPAAGREDNYRIETEEKAERPYCGIIPIADFQCIIVPAYAGEMILKTERICRKLSYPDGFEWMPRVGQSGTADYEYHREKEKIFIFSSSWNMFLEYDMRTERLEGKVCRVPEEWNSGRIMEEYIYPYYMQANVVKGKEAYEESEDDLAAFLYCTGNIKEREVTRNGEKIYRYFTERENSLS